MTTPRRCLTRRLLLAGVFVKDPGSGTLARVLDFSAGTVNAATTASGTVGNGKTAVNALLSRDATVAAFDNDSGNFAPGATICVLRA
jgi:hypothetical protein